MLEINKIYTEDCLDGLRKLEEESVDLVISDPPYNSEKKMGQSFRPDSKNALSQLEWFMYDQMSSRGYLTWLNMVLREVYRTCKQGTHIYLFCNWKSIRNMMDALECAMFTVNDVITWNKGHFGIGFNYRAQTEFIIFASKDKARKLNNAKTPNIVDCKRVKNKDMHTLVQKPVELIEWIIKASGREDDLVLDPFISSGTTAIACKKNNMNYIGFEINGDYVDLAEKRLSQNTIQFPKRDNHAPNSPQTKDEMLDSSESVKNSRRSSYSNASSGVPSQPADTQTRNPQGKTNGGKNEN